MKKRLMSMLLTLAMVVSLLPAMGGKARAAETGNLTLSSGENKSGTNWTWDGSTLTLSGATINGYVLLQSNATIVLSEGTTNRITGGAYTTNNIHFGICGTSVSLTSAGSISLTIIGNGSLTIDGALSAGAKHAHMIAVNTLTIGKPDQTDYPRLTIQSPDAPGHSYGIMCKYLTVNNGNFDITAGNSLNGSGNDLHYYSTAINVRSSGSMTINKGYVKATANAGNAGSLGLTAMDNSPLTINGGVFDIKVNAGSNKAVGIRAGSGSSLSSSTSTSTVTINGGVIAVSTGEGGKAISANNGITMASSEVNKLQNASQSYAAGIQELTQADFSTPLTIGNKTLYTSKTVTFNANGGTVSPTSTTVNNGAAVGTLPTPTRTGYDFGGWYTAASGGTQVTASTTVSDNVTYYAHWTPITYTIAYTLNGGSVATANPTSYNIETDTFTLNDPTRNGYTFNGWTGSNGTTPQTSVSISKGSTGNKSYTANWTANTYTVTFDPNGGSVSPTSKSVTFDSTYGTLPTPTRADYDFAGWYTAAGGGTQVTDTATVAVTGDQTLYAHWTANVTLVPNGVTVTGTDVDALNSDGNYILHTRGNAVNLNSLTVTASGGTFNGWFDNEVPLFGTKVTSIAAASAPMLLAASTTRYITLKDGDTTLGSLLAYVGQPLPGLGSIPTKSGYTFNGYWTTASGGTQYYDADGVGQIGAYGENGNNAATLYARWTEQGKISITASAETGGTVSGGQSDILPGTEVTLIAVPGVGYTFDGWYKDNTRVSTNPTYTFTAGATAAYTARFTPSDGTAYKVEHYQQNLNDSDYTLYETETLYGTTGASVTPAVKSYAGFDAPTAQTVSIAADGSTTIRYEYARKTCSVTLPTAADGYQATAASGSASPVKYGGSYSFTVTVADHYDAANMQVYASGVLLTTESASSPYRYTISNITANTLVTVTGVTVETYTVSFLVDGTLRHSRQVAYNDTLIEPEHPTKAGYTFSAWKKTANTDGTGDLSAWTFGSGGNRVTADTTFVAEWTSVTYTVTLPAAQSGYYSAAASSGYNASGVAYNGDFEFTVTLDSGAESVSSLVVYANGAQLTSTSTSGPAVTYKLTGVTENKVITVSGVGLTTYSVVYYQNTTEYVSNMPSGDVKTHDTALALSNNTPTRTGYTFSTWNTAADGGGTSYAPGASYETNANLTLYAIWTANSYSVTLTTNGGTVNSGNITSYTYGTAATLPAPTRSGYTFGGWYAEANFEGNRVYNISATEMGDKAFYARWTQNPVTPKVKADYNAVYDGAAHTLELDELDNWTVSAYQWYFRASGAEDFTAISGATAATYDVTDVAQSGIYKCHLTGTYSNSGVSYPGAATDTQTGTVTITPMALTITADNDTRAYNGAALTKNSYTVSGLATGDSIASVTVTGTQTVAGSSANVPSAARIVNSSGADTTANYSISYTNGTLTVSKADLNPRGAALSKTVNAALTECELYTLAAGSGNIALTGVTVTNGGEAVTTLADLTRTAGTYTLTVSYTGASGNDASGSAIGTNFNSLSAPASDLTATLTVTNPPPAPSGGGGGGGGGGGIAGGEVITAPVSGDKNTVNVTVSVTGTAATLRSADIEKALDGNDETGAVVIDVSGLRQDITSITIPAETVAAIAGAVADQNNPTDSLTVKLSDGAVTFDAAAVEAIQEQAGGKDLRPNLNGVEVSAMNKTQQAATADLEIEVVLDVYMTSGSTRISDFKGGSAEIRLPFAAPDGRTAAEYRVWHVAEDGALIDQRARYDTSDNCFVFTVTHFSHYVVAYDKDRAACPQDDTCPIAAFADADPAAWYHDGVHWALENGVMGGIGDGLFAPNGTASRAMIAQILYNMEGKPAISPGIPFEDVSASDWYAMAISWAKSSGIIDGYGNGKFGPNDDLTREQLVTIIYRYAKKKGINVSVGEDTNILSYDDTFDVSEWAISAMQWAVGSGLVSGRTASTLNPQDKTTRAEIATIIMRYCTEVAR